MPDDVEPNANVDNETVNSEIESSNCEESDATLPYGLFLSSDLSDSDEEPRLIKRQSKLQTRLRGYQIEIS